MNFWKCALTALIVIIAIALTLWLLKHLNNFLISHYVRARNDTYEFIHKYRALVIIAGFAVVILILIMAINYDNNNCADLGAWASSIVALLLALGTSWQIPPFLKIYIRKSTASKSCSIQIVNKTKTSDFIRLKHLYVTNVYDSDYKHKHNKHDRLIAVPAFIEKYAMYTYIGPHGALAIPVLSRVTTPSKDMYDQEKKFMDKFLHSNYEYLKFDFRDLYNIDIPPVFISKADILKKDRNVQVWG